MPGAATQVQHSSGLKRPEQSSGSRRGLQFLSWYIALHGTVDASVLGIIGWFVQEILNLLSVFLKDFAHF